MIYNNINTNLAGDCYKCLEEGIWEIGLISDNPGLDNIQSDSKQKYIFIFNLFYSFCLLLNS